jgi:hypothetical protein
MSKADFQAYLARPEVLSDIDNGTLNIEQKYLACRATTVSPGGPHRSKNQPFWNAPTPALSIISDAQITTAMNAALSPTRQFSFMKIGRRRAHAAERARLLGMPSGARHRRLPFPRRRPRRHRLLERRAAAGLAAFLRRPAAAAEDPATPRRRRDARPQRPRGELRRAAAEQAAA